MDSAWVFFVGVSPEMEPMVKEARAKGIKTCGYWIGSDSLAAIHNPGYRAGIPTLDAHLCVHERIKAELAIWGIEAQVVYPCARNYVEEEDVPRTKTVGVYSPTPEAPNDLYQHKTCIEIAQRHPEVGFIFYGATYADLPENCTDAGRMTPEETKDILSKVSVVLRLCEHDGFPVGGIEAKIRGRHVIENYCYAGFLFAKTMEDVDRFLEDPKTFEGDCGPYLYWYRHHGKPETFKQKVEKVLL